MMASKCSRAAAVSSFCLGTLVFAPQADAGIWDDIKNFIRTARDRAADARDRAIQARNAAVEVRDHVQESQARVTTEMRAAVQEAAADLQQTLQFINEGRAEFIADGGCSADACEPFRQNLIEFLQNVETLTNTLFDAVGMEGMEVDFQRLIQRVENLPGRALYPVYRVLVEDINLFETDLLDRLPEAIDNLLVLRDAVNQLREESALARSERGAGILNDPEPLLDSELTRDFCVFAVKHPGLLTGATIAINYLGVVFRANELVFTAFGSTVGYEEGDAGVAFLNFVFKVNTPNILGRLIGILGEPLFWIAGLVGGPIDHCVEIAALADVRDAARDAQRELNSKQQDVRLKQDEVLQLQQETLDLLAGTE